jgi:hypothetical protein
LVRKAAPATQFGGLQRSTMALGNAIRVANERRPWLGLP